MHDISLIVLTYKKKLLLTRKDDAINNKNLWSFIGSSNDIKKVFGDTIIREVEKQTSIKLSYITLLTTFYDNTSRRDFYLASLTDSEVNRIQRAGEELQFFTLKETDKLSMGQLSRLLLTQHRDLIEASFIESEHLVV